MSYTREALIGAVRGHAERHYDTGGWDIVVESYDDEQIAQIIGNATDPVRAIALVRDYVGAIDDVRRDVIAAGGGEVQ